jgi:hypothetical protein
VKVTGSYVHDVEGGHGWIELHPRNLDQTSRMRIFKTPTSSSSLVVRDRPESYDRIPLPDPAGGRPLRWTVLLVDPDPHGWKVTAMRCLEGCRQHHRRR